MLFSRKRFVPKMNSIGSRISPQITRVMDKRTDERTDGRFRDRSCRLIGFAKRSAKNVLNIKCRTACFSTGCQPSNSRLKISCESWPNGMQIFDTRLHSTKYTTNYCMEDTTLPQSWAFSRKPSAKRSAILAAAVLLS